jgi:hypothetical protein
MAKLARSLKPIFWDTDLDKIDIQQNKGYIIERILEFGDKPAVKWLLATYSLSDIKKALEESRSISKKSRNFWEILLGDQSHV